MNISASANSGRKKISIYGAMSIIFVLTVSIRLYYLTTLREIIIFPDSIEYLKAADKLSMLRIDASRVPVYPFFILLAHKLFTWLTREQAVILMQIMLSGISMSLIFYQSCILFKSSIKAFIASLFIMSTLWIVSWDMLILTENLTVFMVSALFLFLAFYLKTRKMRFMLLAYTICGALIFLKPFYLLFPIIIFVVFLMHGIVEGNRKQVLNAGAISIAVIYLAVAAYSMLNYMQNNYFGISDVSAVNKLGKVLQYRMYELGDNEKIKGVIRVESELQQGETIDPAELINKYGLGKNGLSEVNEFAGSIIKKHPVMFADNTLKLMFAGNKLFMENAFSDYNKNNYRNNRPEGFFQYIQRLPFKFTFGLIYYLILVDLIFFVLLIFLRKKFEWYWIFTSVFIIYQVIFSAAGAHAEYQRLIVPIYVLLFLTVFKYIYLLFDFIKECSDKAIRYSK